MKKIPDILKEKAIGFVFNLVSLLVIVVVLLLVIWAFAAFTEPSSAPSASNQDFAQNILGADNNDNSFASTNVAANVDGSIIERLEYLWANRSSFGISGFNLRQYYLTTGTYNGSTADTACTSGYHMANLFEIFDTSNLKYNTSVGYANADSGQGPPIGIVGWIRTGYIDYAGASVISNCNSWTIASGGYGTVTHIPTGWNTSTFQFASPWYSSYDSCDNTYKVWCVQDY